MQTQHIEQVDVDGAGTPYLRLTTKGSNVLVGHMHDRRTDYVEMAPSEVDAYVRSKHVSHWSPDWRKNSAVYEEKLVVYETGWLFRDKTKFKVTDKNGWPVGATSFDFSVMQIWGLVKLED